MGTFEKIAMFVMLSVCIGLFVGGVAAMIGMAVELYEADARRARKWVRSFFAARKEAKV